MNVRYSGRLIPDHEGDDLANEEAVHAHALATALISSRHAHGYDPQLVRL
jgi:hypothetical protein